MGGVRALLCCAGLCTLERRGEAGGGQRRARRASAVAVCRGVNPLASTLPALVSARSQPNRDRARATAELHRVMAPLTALYKQAQPPSGARLAVAAQLVPAADDPAGCLVSHLVTANNNVLHVYAVTQPAPPARAAGAQVRLVLPHSLTSPPPAHSC